MIPTTTTAIQGGLRNTRAAEATILPVYQLPCPQPYYLRTLKLALALGIGFAVAVVLVSISVESV